MRRAYHTDSDNGYHNAVVLFHVASDPSLTKVMERLNIPTDDLAIVMRTDEIFRASYYPAQR